MGLPIVPSGECRRSKINRRALPRSGPKPFTGSALEPAWTRGFSPLQRCWAALDLLLVPPVRVAGPQSSRQMFCSVYADVKFLFDHSSRASSCSFSHFGGWEPVALMALSDELEKVEPLQCCFSPLLGSWPVSVALECRMEDCSLLLPFPAFGVHCFLPGGARLAKAVRKVLRWEGEVGPGHTSNGEN